MPTACHLANFPSGIPIHISFDIALTFLILIINMLKRKGLDLEPSLSDEEYPHPAKRFAGSTVPEVDGFITGFAIWKHGQHGQVNTARVRVSPLPS